MTEQPQYEAELAFTAAEASFLKIEQRRVPQVAWQGKRPIQVPQGIATSVFGLAQAQAGRATAAAAR